MVATYLHDLCSQNSRSEHHKDHVLDYLSLHREEAREECDDGRLPLHFLLQNRPSLELVSVLIEAYPESVYCYETVNFNFPLHIACRSGCDVDVVEYLILRNPSALKYKTHNAYFCCIEKLIFPLMLRSSLLSSYSCMDLVKKLPEDDPNRAPLLEVLNKHCGDTRT